MKHIKTIIHYSFFVLLFFSFHSSLINAQDNSFIASNYNKAEYRIEMRDGVTLFTAVYTPKDTSKEYPIILFRTPYQSSPYGENNFPSFTRWGVPIKIVEEGCIFVSQDVRGKFM